MSAIEKKSGSIPSGRTSEMTSDITAGCFLYAAIIMFAEQSEALAN